MCDWTTLACQAIDWCEEEEEGLPGRGNESGQQETWRELEGLKEVWRGVRNITGM